MNIYIIICMIIMQKLKPFEINKQRRVLLHPYNNYFAIFSRNTEANDSNFFKEIKICFIIVVFDTVNINKLSNKLRHINIPNSIINQKSMLHTIKYHSVHFVAHSSYMTPHTTLTYMCMHSLWFQISRQTVVKCSSQSYYHKLNATIRIYVDYNSFSKTSCVLLII